jgi:hypothetical protein
MLDSLFLVWLVRLYTIYAKHCHCHHHFVYTRRIYGNLLSCYEYDENYTISITVNEVEKSYPDPVTYNILYVVGVAMAIASVFLAIRMKHLATKMKPLTVEDIT